MEAKYLRLSKLYTAQMLIGILLSIVLQLIPFDSRIPSILHIAFILVIGAVISVNIHSMQKINANFKIISVMCFFGSIFHAIRQLTSDLIPVIVVSTTAIIFTAIYVAGFASVTERLLSGGDPDKIDKWEKFRKVFIILSVVMALSTILLYVLDLYAMIVLAVTKIIELVLAIRFISLLRKATEGNANK